MKRFFLTAMFLALLGAVLFAFDNSPKLTSVEPDSAKVGDPATAKGENLDKAMVANLFLTDGKNDVKVTITNQSGAEIKFTVPKIASGRYRLMTVTKAAMIEQPVMLTVE